MLTPKIQDFYEAFKTDGSARERKHLFGLLKQANKLFEYRDGMLFHRISSGSRAVAGRRAGSKKTRGYRRVYIYGEQYNEHRVIWLLVREEEPPETIDHIDGNPSNNRIENLRAIDPGHNSRRALKGRGYYFRKTANRWVAQPNFEGRSVYTGCFKTEKEAAQAVADFRAKHDIDYT
jgi:hypothetical protein